jgi:accessory gene regulator protein AgrB
MNIILAHDRIYTQTNKVSDSMGCDICSVTAFAKMAFVRNEINVSEL